MISLRELLAMALVALFLVPPAQAGNGDCGEAAAAPRSEWKQPSAAEVELKLAGALFNSTSCVIPVPANATISSASVDLLGKMVKGNLTTKACDYSDKSTGHMAYKGMVTTFAPTTSLASLSTGFFGTSDYDAVALSDNNRVAQSGDYSGDIDGYELFRFHVPVDESSQVDVQWEGYAGDIYSGGAMYSTWIWNAAVGMWEPIETGNPLTDKVVTKQCTGDWYVDNRTVNVLAKCDDGNDILTDHVKVTVQGYPYYYPTNLTMDLGANGKVDWSLEEQKFNYSITVNDPALAAELQELAKDSPTQNLNVTVKLTSETAGKVKISNFQFTYIAPPWCRGIPDTYHLEEDSAAEKLIDLRSYFYEEGPTITYSISYQQDAKKLKAELAPDGHSLTFRTIAKNWWGKLKFRVTATDGDALVTESSNFTVTVDPVNDPPEVLPIGDQKAAQGAPFSLQVKAKDVDTDLNKSERINFSDDTKLFDIDPAAGWVNFTPKQSDVGVSMVTITATDSEGAAGKQSFTMTVEDTEDPPVLRPIPDQSATENELFTYTVNASDPDVPYGDSLTFSDDSALFDIDPATGTISFTPKTSNIGIYRITITVKDIRNKSDRRTMNLTIRNYLGTVDKPPSMDQIPDMTAVDGETFTYTVNATDPDIDSGDFLAFSDNSPLFAIGAADGAISFVPNGLNVGIHKITVKVEDQDGLTASATFRLTILKKNAPPVITKIRPKTGTKALVDHNVFLTADATDPDGDRLDYTWKDGDTVLGTGSAILATFNATGVHTITLVVSDGRAEVSNTTNINIVKSLPSKSTPGFGAALALAVALVAIIGKAGARRR